MNKKLIAALSLPVIFMAGWMGILSFERCSIQHDVIIAVSGYDPRDLLSGHYIDLNLNWKDTDCSQFFEKVCPQKAFLQRYKFYLPEKDAADMQTLINRSGNNLDLALVFSYQKDKRPVLKEKLVDNENWKTWLNKQDIK